ncbi:sensor histidine kinase [Sunxiuqinia sp. A32]|uniref:sensor histidine kinase n=1 Tax=Sunxiuqinia sp. A32 TaxID=3461496 RepID=UPI004045AFBE
MEKLLSPIFKNRFFQHFLFWFSYVLVFGFLYGKYGHDYFYYFKESLYMLPFVMIAAYTIIYLILPTYLKKRKLFLVAIGSFSILFVVVLFQRISLRIINELEIDPNKLLDLTFLYMFLETSFMVGVALVIKLMKNSIKQQQEKHEIEKQNLQSELKLLKAQIQPHFLFNTMNNLYALSLDQSVKTSEGIAKLSELLSIILYECNESVIELEKEVALLQNYIDLEKLRYGKRLKISFDIEGNIQDKQVAPMLFITFLENCFKHGSSKDPNSPWIKVELKATEDEIIFRAENSIYSNAEIEIDKNESGIGLENVRRRLDLLYDDRYRLEIRKLNDKFMVELTLSFKKYV